MHIRFFGALMCLVACALAQPTAFLYGSATGDLTTSRTDPTATYFPQGAPLPSTFKVLGQSATHFMANPAGWVIVNATAPSSWMDGLYQPPFPLSPTTAMFGVAVSYKAGNGTLGGSTDVILVAPAVYYSAVPSTVSAAQQQNIAANKQKANLLVASAFPNLSPAFSASDIFVFTFENTTHFTDDFSDPNQVLPYISTVQLVLVTDGSRTFAISHYPKNNLQAPVFAGIATGSQYVSFAPAGTSTVDGLLDSRVLNRVGNAGSRGSIVARVDSGIVLPTVSSVAACSSGSACDDQDVCTTESCLPSGLCTSSYTGDLCSNSSIPAKCAVRVCSQATGCTVYDARIDPAKKCFHPDPCVTSSCDANAGCVYTPAQTCNNPSFFTYGPSAGDSTIQFPPRNLGATKGLQLFISPANVKIPLNTPFLHRNTPISNIYLTNEPSVALYDTSLQKVRVIYNLEGDPYYYFLCSLMGVDNATEPLSDKEAELGLTPNVLYYRQRTRSSVPASQLGEFQLADRVVQNSFGDKLFQTQNLVVVTAYRPFTGLSDSLTLTYMRQLAIAYNGPRTYVFFTGAGIDQRPTGRNDYAPGITDTNFAKSFLNRFNNWNNYGTNTGNSSLGRLFALRSDVMLSAAACPCYDADWCTTDTCNSAATCSFSAIDCSLDQSCTANYCNQPEGCASSATPNCAQTHDYLDVTCSQSSYSVSDNVDCVFTPRNATDGTAVAISFNTFFAALSQKLNGQASSLLEKSDFLQYDVNRPGGGGYSTAFRLYRKFSSTGRFFVSYSSGETNTSRVASFNVYGTPAYYGVTCDNQLAGSAKVLLSGSSLTCTVTVYDSNNVNIFARFADITFDQSSNPAAVITSSAFTGVPSDGLSKTFSFSAAFSLVGQYTIARSVSDAQAVLITVYVAPTSAVVSCQTPTAVGNSKVCQISAKDSNGANTYALASALGTLVSSNTAVAAVVSQAVPPVGLIFSFSYNALTSGVATISSANLGISVQLQIYDTPDATQTSFSCPTALLVGNTQTCTITPRKNGAVIYTLASLYSAFSSNVAGITVGTVSPAFGNAHTVQITGVAAGPAVISSTAVNASQSVIGFTSITALKLDCPSAIYPGGAQTFQCTVTPYQQSDLSKPTYGFATDFSVSCSGGECEAVMQLPSLPQNRFVFSVLTPVSGPFTLTAHTANYSDSLTITECRGCGATVNGQLASIRLNTQMPTDPAAFIQNFITDICTAARISCDRVSVNPTLRSGSVIVDFAILPANSTSNEPSPLAVVQDLQQQLATPGSRLLSGTTTSTAIAGSLSASSSTLTYCDGQWKVPAYCSSSSSDGLSGGAIAGIVIGTVAGAVIIVLLALTFTGKLKCDQCTCCEKKKETDTINDGVTLEATSSKN